MGILITAAITTVLVAVLYGYIIKRMSDRADWPVLLVAAVIALPLQPLAFLFVRLPLHHWLSGTLGTGALLTAITLFYAPLTEEPAKWLPLLVPAVRRRLTPNNALALALAVGLGFGIGEIWLLATQLAAIPAVAAEPFYKFGGFVFERTLVCFIHGGLIALAYSRLASGRSFLVGGFVGIVLHFGLNFPIFVAGAGWLGIPPPVWMMLLTLWIMAFAIGLAVLLARLSGGRFRDAVLGYSDCSECGAHYPRPLFAAHLGPIRYERCPQCRHFHWIRHWR